MFSARKKKLLLIEVVPGSGKSTTAEAIYRVCCASGVDTKWYREELVDHPVHPRSLKRASLEPDFPIRCLGNWKRFVADAKQTETLHVLEGSAFQSTVRYMMELDYEPTVIFDYF